VRGAHDWADHERVASQMRDMIRVIPLFEGNGCLGPSEPRWDDEGVDGC
jgi:hypothetical protein